VGKQGNDTVHRILTAFLFLGKIGAFNWVSSSLFARIIFGFLNVKMAS